MDKQVTLFLSFIRDEKKLSDNTLQSYQRDLVQYMQYLDNNRMNLYRVRDEDIKDYLKHLEELNKV